MSLGWLGAGAIGTGVGNSINVGMTGNNMSAEDAIGAFIGGVGSEVVEDAIGSVLKRNIAKESVEAAAKAAAKVTKKASSSVIKKIAQILFKSKTSSIGLKTGQKVGKAVMKASMPFNKVAQIGDLLIKELVKGVKSMNPAAVGMFAFDVAGTVLDFMDPFNFNDVVTNKDLAVLRLDTISSLQDMMAQYPVTVNDVTYTGGSLPPHMGGPLSYPMELTPEFPELNESGAFYDPALSELMATKQIEWLMDNGYRIESNDTPSDQPVDVSKILAALESDPVPVSGSKSNTPSNTALANNDSFYFSMFGLAALAVVTIYVYMRIK